jgi:hypothetical protein
MNDSSQDVSSFIWWAGWGTKRILPDVVGLNIQLGFVSGVAQNVMQQNPLK